MLSDRPTGACATCRRASRVCTSVTKPEVSRAFTIPPTAKEAENPLPKRLLADDVHVVWWLSPGPSAAAPEVFAVLEGVHEMALDRICVLSYLGFVDYHHLLVCVGVVSVFG